VRIKHAGKPEINAREIDYIKKALFRLRNGNA